MRALERHRDLFANLWVAAVLCLVLLAIAVAGSEAAGGTQRYITSAFIKMIAVVGLYIFVGNSGIISFGHISFMAVGAYVTAWLVIAPETKALLLPGLPAFLTQAHWPPSAGILAGGFAASTVALLFGLPLTRLSGISASIGTFTMLAIVTAVTSNWTALTGGKSSLYGLQPYTSIFVCLAWLAAAIFMAALYQASRRGFRLRGSRENEVSARSVGINVSRERLLAFVLSAFFVGVAGGLWIHFLGVVVAREFYLKMTFITLAMLVIGGTNSLTGAVVGSVFVSFLSELLRLAERGMDVGFAVIPGRPGLQEMGLAMAMLAILIFRPRGLTGGREIPAPLPLHALPTRTTVSSQ